MSRFVPPLWDDPQREADREGGKYGTAWSTIARDPILLNRKSTDLRDRFRNAFPDL